MKVLLNSIARNSTPGSTNMLFRIADSYSKFFREDKVEFLLSDKEAITFQKADTPVKIVGIKHSYSPVLKNFLIEKRIHSEINKLKPEVVLTFHPVKINSDYRQFFLAAPALNNLLREKEALSEKLKDELWYDIENSKAVIVFSELEKHLITTLFTGIWEKITVIHKLTPAGNRPVTTDKRQIIKDKIAGGNEFFLCPVAKDEDTTINLLKGFSGFKKWQRSSMKLILVSPENDQDDKLGALISSYRFKKDVGIIPSACPEMAKCIASAYAVFLPDKYDSDMEFAIKTLEAQAPLIIPSGSVYSEVVKDSAFHFTYQNKDDITRVMLESFREESKISRLIQSSKDILTTIRQKDFYTTLRNLLVEN